MDLSLCGTDRMWWVHGLCLSAGGFVSSGVTQSTRNYFLTSGVCLQARDCIGNALDLLSAFFFLVEMGGAMPARIYTLSIDVGLTSCYGAARFVQSWVKFAYVC